MKRLLALLIIALMLIPTTGAFAEGTAEDLRLVSARGTVSVTDGKDQDVTVSDGMELLDGYALKTGAGSGAWISLGGSRSVKLGANTCAKIIKKGDRLVLELVAGSLLVDGSAPLRRGETLEIHTSTSVTGVNGAILVVKAQDDGSTEVYSLKGSAAMTVTVPGTSKTKEVTIEAWQLATSTATSGTQAGGDEVSVREFTAEDVDDFVRDEIAADSALAEQLRQSASPVVRALAPLNVTVPLATGDTSGDTSGDACPVYVQLVLTGDASDVATLEKALEEEPYLVVDINSAEPFQPGSDVALGKNQTVNLSSTDLDLAGDDLVNAGTVTGDSDSDLLAGDVENSGAITFRGTIDLTTLTNTGTVDIGSEGNESTIAILNNNEGGVINVRGKLIITTSLSNTVGGVINVLDGGRLLIQKFQNLNSGKIVISDDGEFETGEESFILNHGGRIDNAGTIINNSMISSTAGGTITNAEGGTINHSGYSMGFVTGAKLVNNGTINNNAAYLSAVSGATIENSEKATINNSGLLSVGYVSNDHLDVKHGTLNNNGIIINTDGGNIDNAGGVITNGGTITNDRGAVINNDITLDTTKPEGERDVLMQGSLTNSGIITNSGTLTNNGAEIDNSGTITNNSEATIYNQKNRGGESTGTIINNGTIDNSGTITGDGIISGTAVNVVDP